VESSSDDQDTRPKGQFHMEIMDEDIGSTVAALPDSDMQRVT